MRARSRFNPLRFILPAFLATTPCLRSAECDMDLRGGFIWLEVTCPRSDRPARFLLDSGAETTVVDIETARNWGLRLKDGVEVLGVGGTGTASQAEPIELHLAGVTHHTAPLALDLSAVSRRCGRRIDGLLGADFFQGRVVQIDYREEKIRLFSSSYRPGAGVESLPIRRHYGALCVAVSVDGATLPRVRIDTGCDGNLHWSGSGASDAETSDRAVSIGLVRARSTAQTNQIRLGNLDLSRQRTVRHPNRLFPGEDGLMGNGLLKRYRVTVDMCRQILFLESE